MVKPVAAATGVAYRVVLDAVGHTAVWRAAAGFDVVVAAPVLVDTAGAVVVGAPVVVGDVDELPHPAVSTTSAHPAATTGNGRPRMGPSWTRPYWTGRAEGPAHPSDTRSRVHYRDRVLAPATGGGPGNQADSVTENVADAVFLTFFVLSVTVTVKS